MKSRLLFFLILFTDAFILFFQASELSISSSEASILHGNLNLVQYITNLSLNIFGYNDIALRNFMILLHLGSVFLLYLISKEYLKKDRDRLWLVLFFILLPGSVSSALVVSHASVIIFFLLLFIYLEKSLKEPLLYITLFIYLFLDEGMSYLFVALVFYYFSQKRYYLVAYNISLFIFSYVLYGTIAHGYPSGHFLDFIAVYSAIFSPIIFIYIFYSLYRNFLLKKLDLVWYISTTAFLISMILSFRQRVNLEYFAPYLMMAILISAKTFESAYRVRLRLYRKKYKFLFIVSFLFLVLNTLVVFFNKELYFLIDNPKKHFAYDLHIAHPLASKLKELGIDAITTNKEMQQRLKFYGISKSDKYRLDEVAFDDEKERDVTICYKNKILYKADVTKLNIK